jgi:choline-glycine betaine transporter
VSILVAAPFLVILVAVCVTLVRQLREEPVTATVPEGVYSVVRQHAGASNGRQPDSAAPAPVAPEEDEDERAVPPARTHTHAAP